MYAVSDGTSTRHRVCVDVTVAAAPDPVWANVADVGAIAQFALGLASSRVRGGVTTAPGAVRECTDRRGRTWAERLTLLDHVARQLEVEFLTTEPGFPFPVTTMIGGWSVQPASSSGASTVRVWLEVTLRRPCLAAVLLPVMGWQSQR